MSANINTLLEELYALEPSLRTKETAIKKIIKSMLKTQPEITIDEDFRAQLRAKITTEIRDLSPNPSPIGEGKGAGVLGRGWGWPALSGVLACALWGVFVTPSSPTIPSALISFQPEIKQVHPNAFSITNANTRAQGGGGGMGIGIGREMAVSNTIAPIASISPIAAPASDAPVSNTSKMVSSDSMIYPPMDFPMFNYVYSGDLKLPTDPQKVYKKTPLPLAPNSTKSILAALHIDSIDLGALSNPGVTNISLTEDREFGYMTNIDFATGTISIYQNYMKWPQPVCDMNGCNQKELTESDIPNDSTIRSAADAFLDKFGIDTSFYGEPIIDSSWRIWFERSAVGGMPQTIPEMYTITYPYMLDGQIIYEEGGMARGLTMNYDVRTGRITSFYGLEKQSLEGSEYPAISDMELVQKMINQGTRYIMDNRPVEPTQKVVDIALGDPKIGYLHVYGEWKNGRSDEFLVPALIFPVTGKPELENTYYYIPTTITIPLVADFVQKSEWANPMPMPLIDPAAMEAPMKEEAMKR